MSRLVFIYSSPVSTRARVTIEHHRYWQCSALVLRLRAEEAAPKPRRLDEVVTLAMLGRAKRVMRPRCYGAYCVASGSAVARRAVNSALVAI